jgi:hypothetical protein
MLLSLRAVLVAFNVVVLAVMLCGGAMRFGYTLVMGGSFCVGLAGHMFLPLTGRISGLSRAALIVFAAGAFVVFSEWDGLVALFDCPGKISSGKIDPIGA